MSRKMTAEGGILVFITSFALYELAGLIMGFFMDAASDAYLFLAYAIPQISYIAVTLVYAKLMKLDFKLLPPKESVKPFHYIIALGLGVGIFFFGLFPSYGLQKLFYLLGKNPTVNLPEMTSPLNVFLGIVIICIMPAIGEEMVFRKAFNDGFSCYGQINAIIISGVLFGISHLNLAQTVHQIFLGCVLSLLYVKTKNLTLTMIVHFINNLLALTLSAFTAPSIWESLTVLGICFAAGLSLTAAGVIYLIKKPPKLSNERTEKFSVWTAGFIALFAVLWIVIAVIG